MICETWSDPERPLEPPIDWIWAGLVAPGQLTLLTGLWKTGKTTLLAHLLAHRHSQAPLVGAAVRPGVTAVITEEPPALWQPRCRKLAIGRDVCFFHRPFRGNPTPAEFAELVRHLLDLRARRKLDLVVLDPLARFLPLRAENSAQAMHEALAPLQLLTEARLAVLLCHHPRKGEPTPGQAARGSGALPACADILLELHPFTAGVPSDRRRLLLGFSRWEETPPRLALELNAEGTAYRVLSAEPQTDFPDYWLYLQGVLEDAPGPATRAQIREQWGDACPRPAMRTLWTWLSAACAQKLVARSGTGRVNDPFRYWLPGRMHRWLADPLWCLLNGLPPPTSSEPSSAPSDESAAPPPSAEPAPPVALVEAHRAQTSPSPQADVLRWLDSLR